MRTASLIPTVLAHLLAIYLVLAAPWLGRLWYQRARERSQTGDPLAKARLFRELVAEQVVTACAVCGLWAFGGIPATRLGLCAPRSWWLTAGLAAVIAGLLLRSAIRLRPKANRLREKLQDSVGALLPDTLGEQRWFVAVSVGAGISEELAFRGFLFYYLSIYVPHVNNLEKVLLTALFFGMAHLYQGWGGIAKTSMGGVILAGFYLLSGSLVLPMVVHAMVDMQVPLIFWPATSPRVASQEAA